MTDFCGRHTLQGRLLFSGPPGCSQDLCGALPHMVRGRGTLSEDGLRTPAPHHTHTHTHPYLAGCFALAESPQTVAGRPGARAGRRLGARSPRNLLPGPSQLGLNEPHAPATTGAAPTSLFPQTLPGPLGAYLRGPHVQGLQVGRPKSPVRSRTCWQAPSFLLGPQPPSPVTWVEGKHIPFIQALTDLRQGARGPQTKPGLPVSRTGRH